MGARPAPRSRAAADRAFEEIVRGEEASRTVRLTRALVDAFAAVSGDSSPIHMDTAAARARGFEDRIAHGALLVGLVSGLVGTRIPGARGVLHSIEMKFKRPCRVGQRVTVTVRVGETIPSVRTVVLEATVRDEAGGLLAKGRFQSGVSDAALHGDGRG